MFCLYRLVILGVIVLQLMASAAGLPFPVSLTAVSVTQPSSPSPGHPQLHARSDTRKTVIGGHGVVLLPGNAPIQSDGQETRRITVGGSTYQVVAGVDTTIDGVPVKDYVPVEHGDSEEEPLGGMSPGKAAAVAFAEAAERIQRQS